MMMSLSYMSADQKYKDTKLDLTLKNYGIP